MRKAPGGCPGAFVYAGRGGFTPACSGGPYAGGSASTGRPPERVKHVTSSARDALAIRARDSEIHAPGPGHLVSYLDADPCTVSPINLRAGPGALDVHRLEL